MKLSKRYLIILMTLVAVLIGWSTMSLAANYTVTINATTNGKYYYKIGTNDEQGPFTVKKTPSVAENTTITIRAVANTGYTLQKWAWGTNSSSCPMNSTIVYKVTAARTYTATFTKTLTTVYWDPNDGHDTNTGASASAPVNSYTCALKRLCPYAGDVGGTDNTNRTIMLMKTRDIQTDYGDHFQNTYNNTSTSTTHTVTYSELTIKRHTTCTGYMFRNLGTKQLRLSNVTVDGGATYQSYDARNGLTLTNTPVNAAMIDAGSAPLVMTNVILQNGYHKDHGAGAIFCNQDTGHATSNTATAMTLTNVTIRGFWAGHGTAIYFKSPDYHNAVLTNVKIYGCYADGSGEMADGNLTTGPSAGVIRTNGGTRTSLTLKGCEFYYNRSDFGAGTINWYAGGTASTKLRIEANGSTATRIHHNRAHAGGAIATTGLTELISVEIDHNVANYGGALNVGTYTGGHATYVGQGTQLTIQDGVNIHHNTALLQGGAIYYRIRESNDVGFNPSNNPISPEFKLSITGGSITHNHAAQGGAIAILDSAPNKHYNKSISKWSGVYVRKLEIEGSAVISDNYTFDTTATFQTFASWTTNHTPQYNTVYPHNYGKVGGGIYVYKWLDPTLMNSSNSYGYTYTDSNCGGAGTMTVNVYGSSEIKNNKAEGNNEMDGGAFRVNNNNVYNETVYDISHAAVNIYGSSKIWNNSCLGNGGAFHLQKAEVKVYGNTEIYRNASVNHGGGVYITGGSFTMEGGFIGKAPESGTFNGNQSTNGNGGGFYVTNGNCTINGGTIAYNKANESNGLGGGFFVNSSSGSTTINSNEANTIISNNTATEGGGAYINNGSVTIESSNGNTTTMQNNTASSGNGGGIYGKDAVTITGATISSNHADSGLGGGIYALAGSNSITVQSSASISSNTAIDGAGLYAASGTVDVKTNSTITSNVASQNGGGIYANGGTVNVNTATISNNSASQYGGGLYIPATGKLTLTGTSTLSGNHVPSTGQGGGVYLAGVVEVGTTATTPTDVITVQDNYKGTSYTYPTTNNRNNIYLPNPRVTTNHTDVITVKENGLASTSKIGFSVPHNFVPVIYCARSAKGTAADPTSWAYLDSFLFGGSMEGVVFDDAEKYSTIHSTVAPYDPDHIYLSNLTWVQEVTTAPTAAEGWSVSGDNVTISSAKGLAYLISYVNGLNDCDGTSHTSVNVNLTADVDMSDYSWVPIGFAESPFNGTFNGNGHTVSGIGCIFLGTSGVTKTGLDLGMFGNVGSDAEIKNVFLQDAYYSSMTVTDKNFVMGGLVANLNGGTVSNSVASAELESDSPTSIMGGLVGKVIGGEVHSSAAMPELSGFTMGGLVGTNASSLYNSFANPQFNYSGPDGSTNYYVGGLVADNGTNGTVQNCYVRFSRTQTLTNALFGQLAGNNGGSITDCYTPLNYTSDVPATIVHTGSATSDTYKVADAPYKYDRPNDNKVGSTVETLTEKLNEWVSGQHDEHPEYAYWKRTTAGNYTTGSGNINDDYPIHKMVGLSNAASPDGLFIEYKYSLDAMLTKYNRLEDGGTVWVYDSPLSAMTASGGTPSYESVSVDNATKVKLYIDEDASLLQAANNTLAAYTGQTLRNYNDNDNRWHNVSSSLKQSGIGFNYGTAVQVPFNWDVNPCSVTLSSDNDNAFFPSDLPWPATAEMDFYCFYEPEYHWINLKRNTGSHWHMNATTVPIVYNGNGIGASTNGNETYMVPGKGYLVSIDKDQLIQNKGELNNGTVTLYSVTKTDYNAWAGLLGYNLLGNPYQSYLDFEVFKTTNSGLWAGTNEYNQTYATFDPEQNAYRQYFAGVSSDAKTASQYIHPHQGFFIRKTANSGDNTVTFTNAMRTNATNGQSGFRGAGQPRHALVNFVVRDAQGNGDIAVLELNRDGDEGAEKIRMGDGTGHVSLGYEGKAYAILFRTKVDGYQPLWFEATETGTFTLGWDIHNAVFESLTLVDNIAGTSTDMLATDTYTFQGSPDHYASRFKVVVGDYVEVDPDAPEEPEPVEGPTFAFIVGDELVVDGEGTLQVFDVMGRQLSSTTLSGTRSTVGLPTAATGVYVLRLTSENGTKVQKIVFGN